MSLAIALNGFFEVSNDSLSSSSSSFIQDASFVPNLLPYVPIHPGVSRYCKVYSPNFRTTVQDGNIYPILPHDRKCSWSKMLKVNLVFRGAARPILRNLISILPQRGINYWKIITCISSRLSVILWCAKSIFFIIGFCNGFLKFNLLGWINRLTKKNIPT